MTGQVQCMQCWKAPDVGEDSFNSAAMALPSQTISVVVDLLNYRLEGSYDGKHRARAAS